MSAAKHGHEPKNGPAQGQPTVSLKRVLDPDDDDGALADFDVRLNETLGPYKLIDFLGQGGMAIVYEAEAPDGSRCALKVLQESPFVPVSMLERFRREAEATKRLGKHPGIVTVYETGRMGRNHYIAMELVSGGRTLADMIAQGVRPITTTLRLAIKIAKALDYAHSQGIVHRDIKSANVLVTRADEPLLADFGLARVSMDLSRSLTVSAMSLGTPRYMAPEQATSLKAANHLSDMYSFGVILYELVTGQSPYTIDPDMGMGEVIRVIKEQPPVHPRRLRPGMPKSLANIILKTLEKDPAERYDSMAEVVTDLTACLNRSGVRATAPSFGRRADRLLFRHRRKAMILAATSGLITSAVFWHRYALDSARHRAVVPRAEAMSQAIELQQMRTEMPASEDDADSLVEVLKQSRSLLLEEHGVAEALRLLNAAIAVENGLHRQRDLQRALARSHLAAGHRLQALHYFSMLREQFARERELRRLKQGDPYLQDGRYGMACFEEALARSLLQAAEEQTQSLWQRALRELPATSPQAMICRGALGHIPPRKLALWSRDQRHTYAALAMLVASLQATDQRERTLWRESARRLANPHVPWLYYYLTFTADTARNGSPTRPLTEESRQ